MLQGSTYVVGMAHVETGHRVTVTLVLTLDASLRDALPKVRDAYEMGDCGYDVEFAVGVDAFHETYRPTWPLPCLGYAL